MIFVPKLPLYLVLFLNGVPCGESMLTDALEAPEKLGAVDFHLNQ